MAAQTRTLRLRSSDDEMFEVEEAVAFQSAFIKSMVDDTGSNAVIPFSNISGKTLAKIIEFCSFHASATASTTRRSEDDIKYFHDRYIQVDQETLYELLLAANFLNIKELLDLTCQTVANVIKNRSVEETRRMFNIINDFTPEEEYEVRKENEWAFE